MNDHFSRHAGDIFNTVKDMRLPAAMQELLESNVAKTRAAFDQFSAVSTDSRRNLDEAAVTAQVGVKAISQKVLDNTAANTAVMFDAAQAMARAKTIPDAARLQADFVQQQLVTATQQTKDLFDLYAHVSKQTFDSLTAATTKTFDQFQKPR